MKFNTHFNSTARTIAAGFDSAVTPPLGPAKDQRGGNIHVVGYPTLLDQKAFMSEAAAKTGDAIIRKLCQNGVLWPQPEAVKPRRSDLLDFGVTNLGLMGQLVPITDVISRPFAYRTAPRDNISDTQIQELRFAK